MLMRMGQPAVEVVGQAEIDRLCDCLQPYLDAGLTATRVKAGDVIFVRWQAPFVDRDCVEPAVIAGWLVQAAHLGIGHLRLPPPKP